MGYLEPILGALGAFVLGFLWYTALFGKAWQKETGITDEEAEQGMAMTHGLAFLMMVIMSFAVNFIIGMHQPEEQTMMHGAFHGLMAGLMYAIPAMTIHYLYQKKSLKLWLIDASYMAILLAVSGGIMGALKLA